jgi:outer membrane protein assembly factor BamB
MLMSRWLRWLVISPVVLFVFGAIFLSCSGGSGSSVATPTPKPGFSLESLTISNGPAPTPTFVPTPDPSATPTRTPKKKTPTPTLTPRPAATSTSVTTNPVQFNSIGTFTKHKSKKIKFEDLTTAPSTFWTSQNTDILIPPLPGPDGGNYTTGLAGCTCIQASNSGVSSQFVGVGVLVDVSGCAPCPTPLPTITPTPKAKGAPQAESTPAPSAQSAGILMWSFDAGAELRGRIATGGDGSIYFITRDGVLHGLDSAGNEIMRRQAEGLAPVVLPNGTVIAMSSASQLAAIDPDGATRWQLEIGAGPGPLAATDSTIYASAGKDLLSVSSAGSLNWRVSVGPVTAAATTPDGVVVASSGGAVTSLASDGAVVWKFTPAGGFSGSVAYADDVVYAGSLSGALYAIDLRTGNPIWRVSTAQAVVAGPAVAPSGTIFFASNAIYGVLSDGQLRWTQPAVKPDRGGLSAVNYDDVFDAATDSLGAMLGSEGNYVWTSRSFGTITTTAVSAAGMLYVGNSNGRIFAIR